MSTLSETLERHLRELQGPSKAPIPKVSANTVPIYEIQRETYLYFQEGPSDKEYHIQLASVFAFQYVVNFQYGRRGGTLKQGTKTDTPVSLTEAQDIYWKLRNEKLCKGYKEK